MKLSLPKIIKDPIFLYFILPCFYITFGTAYALPYSEINLISYLLLYLHIVLNQLMEINLRSILLTKKLPISKQIWALELAIVLTIFYFSLMHSFAAVLFLICYSIMIQTKYLFAYYQLELVSIGLSALFKGFLLNCFGFYIHTGFIATNIIWFCIPVILSIFLYEYYEWNKSLSRILRLSFVSILYLTTILIMRTAYSLWSVLVLLSFVSFLYFNKDNTKLSVLYFTQSFLLIYLTLVLCFQLINL